MYLLIWGTRSPTLAEPLLRGTRWNSLGGAGNDVASANRYVGRERVVVPAFPQGVTAARVESDITQAGALGDPFGSGVRTVWWVRGVGPVQDRVPSRRRRDERVRAGRDEPDAARAAARSQPAAAQPRRHDELPLAQQPPHEGLVASSASRSRRSSTTRRASTSSTCPGRSTSPAATRSRRGSAA